MRGRDFMDFLEDVVGIRKILVVVHIDIVFKRQLISLHLH